MAVDINPIAQGFYTAHEAARLIEVGNTRRILGWLRGYQDRQVGPLLARDYQSKKRRIEELSFLDLVEVRFIEHFRELGVKVMTLRKALANAREVFQHEKPLATDHFRFTAKENKKDILVEKVLLPAAEESHDRKLWSLITLQYEIYEVVCKRLLTGLSFDTGTRVATKWVPRPDRFPEFFIDPAIAYGQPVGPSAVPTGVLYRLWRAEGENLDKVANWYELSVDETRRAIEFEQELERPRQALAA